MAAADKIILMPIGEETIIHSDPNKKISLKAPIHLEKVKLYKDDSLNLYFAAQENSYLIDITIIKNGAKSNNSRNIYSSSRLFRTCLNSYNIPFSETQINFYGQPAEEFSLVPLMVKLSIIPLFKLAMDTPIYSI